MYRHNSPIEYLAANGPEELEKVLDDLLSRTQVDRLFSVEDHYILYRFGDQKSLIKVDTSRIPFNFWYYDLLGRPATQAVKETIAKFLWEKCGEKERYMEKFGVEEEEE